MNLHGKNIIGDKLVAGGEESFRARSPLDNQPLEPDFYHASLANVDEAMELAESAFARFSATSGAARAVLLERIGEEIIALGDTLIERCHAETGLPKERLVGERARTVSQLGMFAALVREGSWVDARIDTAQPDRKPAPKPDLRRMLIPLGPVVVFGASNFPLAFSVAGGDTASALAAGCPVVVKAHEAHPGTSELVAMAIRAAVAATGLPPGVFSMLHGAGPVIGTALVKHSHTRAVGFTGSSAGGRALFDAAASRREPIPVFAEMSSLNPVFILPGALRERGEAIAEGLKVSVTLGVGQFCTKPGLFFGINGKDWDLLEQSLARLVEESLPGTMLHFGICESYQKLIAHAAETDGVDFVAKSKMHPNAAKTQGHTVIMKTSAHNFLQKAGLREEVFGPFALLVTSQSLAELETIALSLNGQLTATVHASPEDFREAALLLKILERKAGRLIINGFPTGVEVCPSMHHGGPYPATTDARFTSIGTAAVLRFARPVCFQNFANAYLPEALRNDNPLGIRRLVNGNPEIFKSPESDDLRNREC